MGVLLTAEEILARLRAARLPRRALAWLGGLWGWKLLLLAVAVAFGAGYCSRRIERPRPTPPGLSRVVPPETVLVRMPPERPRLRQRLTTRSVQPRYVETSPPGTDTTSIYQCRNVVAPLELRANPMLADSVRMIRPWLALRAVRYDQPDVDFWGYTSDGRAYHSSWTARQPWEARVSGDSLVLREHRQFVPGISLSVKHDLPMVGIGVLLACITLGCGR